MSPALKRNHNPTSSPRSIANHDYRGRDSSTSLSGIAFSLPESQKQLQQRRHTVYKLHASIASVKTKSPRGPWTDLFPSKTNCSWHLAYPGLFEIKSYTNLWTQMANRTVNSRAMLAFRCHSVHLPYALLGAKSPPGA